MVLDKKTKKDVVGITTLGVGLGALTAVEAAAKPPVPVVSTFAPVAAVAGPVIGAGMVIRSMSQLGKVGIPKKEIVKRRAPIRKSIRSFL